MQFRLTLDEVNFIKETFHFSQLLCVENKKANAKTAQELITKKVVADKGTYFELSNEYRLLFKHWSQMEFTMFRPLEATKKRLDCIMANDRAVIVYRQLHSDIVLDYFDFDENAIDSLIAGFAKLSPTVVCENTFILSLSIPEAQDFFEDVNKSNLIPWQKKTGIPTDLLSFCVTNLAQKSDNMILIENHKKSIGCLVQIVNTDMGIIALKHITPPEKEHERMVLVFGTAHYVVNSLYNL